MIIAIASLGSLLLGVFLVFFGIKLIKFSLKGIFALIFCFGISFGFWRNYDAAQTTTVIDDTTIMLNFPATIVRSMEVASMKQQNDQVEIHFNRLPIDGLFATVSGNEHRFFHIIHSENKITKVVELEKPVGWMAAMMKSKKEE